MSKVSIVVPIYNAGIRLKKCIKSILKQSFRDFELILVNDGSTDRSLDLCKYFQQKDTRIKLINKVNEGCIKARKKGIEVAKSDYIMFVDADDWVDKEIVGTLYHEAIENDLDVSVCNMYKVLGSSTLIKQKNNSRYFQHNRIFIDNEIKNDLVVAYFHGHPFPSSLCAKLYKKDLLLNSGKYLEQIKFLGEDLYYNLEVLLKAKRIKVVEEPLYYYRLGGSTSKYKPYLYNDMITGYRIQKDVIGEYYSETKEKQMNGISIMLLNTFKTCLLDLFNSHYNDLDKKMLINKYLSSDILRETLENKGVQKYFSPKYLKALKDNDVDFLFELGKSMYVRNRSKRFMVTLLTRLSLI